MGKLIWVLVAVLVLAVLLMMLTLSTPDKEPGVRTAGSANIIPGI